MFCVQQLSFEGTAAFSPRPIDMSNVTLSRDMQVGYFIIYIKFKKHIDEQMWENLF